MEVGFCSLITLHYFKYQSLTGRNIPTEITQFVSFPGLEGKVADNVKHIAYHTVIRITTNTFGVYR